MQRYSRQLSQRLGVSLALLLSVCLVPLEVLAFYHDTEANTGNSLSAAAFDVVLTDTVLTENMGLGLIDEVEFDTLLLQAAGSLDPQYIVSTSFGSSTPAVCDALTLDASHNAYDYSGTVADFVAPTTTTLGTWELDFELQPTVTNYAHGDVCELQIHFDAWRAGVERSASGYDDRESVQVAITAHTVVMNEFLPDPDGILCTDGTSNCAPGDPEFIFDFGSDHSSMPQGEWIELYNNSDFPADVSGWYFEDAASNTVAITAANTLPATTTIAANDWLVVYMNKAFLNNAGDTFTLHDASGTPIDTYTYSGSDTCDKEPTPGDPNDPSIGSPGCSGDVPPNKSYARIPDGIGDFVDPIPSPGAFNTVSADELRAAGWSEAEIAALGERVTDAATSTASTTTTNDAGEDDEDTPRFRFNTSRDDNTGSSSNQVQTDGASTTASTTVADTSTTTDDTSGDDSSTTTGTDTDQDTASTTVDRSAATSAESPAADQEQGSAPNTGNDTESTMPAKQEEEDTDGATDSESAQADDTKTRQEEATSAEQTEESDETVSDGDDAGTAGSASDPDGGEAATRPEDAPAPDETEQVTESTSV